MPPNELLQLSDPRFDDFNCINSRPYRSRRLREYHLHSSYHRAKGTGGKRVTAEVAAQRLRDAMTEVVRGANARMKGTDIELQSDEPNIIVPAVNLSLDTIISALRTFFRSSARRNISGDITDSKSKLWLRLRLNGKIFYTSSIGVSPDHPEQLFDGVASKVFWQIHPYVVASEISHTDNAKALELVNMIVVNPAIQMKTWHCHIT